MREVLLVARRELGAYFNSLWGWAIVAAILVVDGLLFNAFAVGDAPKLSSDVLQDFFYFAFGTTVLSAIFVTMRLIAEERQTGTIVLIDSSPLADWQVVLGKYLSALGVVWLTIVLTLYMPALIFVNGKVSLAHIATGYLGLLLVGAAATAVGTFGSTVARSQLVAVVFSAAMLSFLVLSWLLARIVEAPLAEPLAYASLFNRHFNPMRKGQLGSEDIIYFLSLVFLFLMLSVRWLAVRRWR